jgi:hypothetical protein
MKHLRRLHLILALKEEVSVSLKTMSNRKPPAMCMSTSCNATPSRLVDILRANTATRSYVSTATCTHRGYMVTHPRNLDVTCQALDTGGRERAANGVASFPLTHRHLTTTHQSKATSATTEQGQQPVGAQRVARMISGFKGLATSIGGLRITESCCIALPPRTVFSLFAPARA